jgi:5-hydroxyisourate hydrolase-like protein (transthyretin family)
VVKIGAYQHQFDVSDFFDAIANDSSHSLSARDKIQLHFRVKMDGEIKKILGTIKDQKTILVG